jgi:hypothetical protein
VGLSEAVNRTLSPVKPRPDLDGSESVYVMENIDLLAEWSRSSDLELVNGS